MCEFIWGNSYGHVYPNKIIPPKSLYPEIKPVANNQTYTCINNNYHDYCQNILMYENSVNDYCYNLFEYCWYAYTIILVITMNNVYL